MKSHTGDKLSLGKGSIYSTSVRRNLNTRESTEAELVGVADVMPVILWRNYFLESQGYSIVIDIFQDKQSPMLLENNGRDSSG